MKPNEDSFHRHPFQNGYRRSCPSVESFTGSQIRVITLRRRGNMPLGFSIRGGWEHGTGIFISEVQPGSIAQRQGLHVGDQIVRINGFSIHRAIHLEVLNLLKTCPGIVLKVKRIGILPIKEKRKDPITWRLVDPRSVLPYNQQNEIPRIDEYISENCIIVKIEFNVPGSSSLGCSIARGPPEMPGIFMCTVKEGGVADQSGLEVGDQIMEMNGTSFADIKLSDAVALMKSTKDIRLTVKKAAGICLFTEYNTTNQIINRSDSQTNGNHTDSKSQKHRQSSHLKEHDFSGSSSSKSEESSFQSSVSSDSEKDYSLSEESGISSLKPNQNGVSHLNGWHKKSPKTNGYGENCNGSITKTEDAWIQEEKKKLEAEQRKLLEEKSKLEEERKRLEFEKLSQCSISSEQTVVKDSFLDEIQKRAAKMSIKDDKSDIDQLLLERRKSNGSSRTSTLKQGTGKHKNPEDALKRRQHEMLMEEFREAHRKMFGQSKSSDSCSNGNSVQSTSLNHTTNLFSKSPAHVKESSISKITINGQHPNLHSQTLPRPERIVSSHVKTFIDDMDSPNKKNIPGTVNFKVTFGTKSGKESSQNTLVEVSPWTTRL